MKQPKHLWVIAVLASIVIHFIFCVQAVSVAEQGGMVCNELFMLLFFPHVMLMYFLPPAYPIQHASDGVVVVDWVRFAGKLAIAYPASLAYGMGISALWYLICMKKAA